MRYSGIGWSVCLLAGLAWNAAAAASTSTTARTSGGAESEQDCAMEDQLAVAWAGNRATEVDLSTLRSLVGDARIVGYGEAMHGAQEFLVARNQIFRYLVEDMGFSAIAAETGFSDSILADDYVLGQGRLDARTIAAVFSFSAPAAVGANRELLEWMRAYNARPDTVRPVRFYGLEPVGRVGSSAALRAAADLALEYAKRVDSAAHMHFKWRLDELLMRMSRDGYSSLAADDRGKLTLGLGDLVALYQRRRVYWSSQSVALDYDRGYRAALDARALDADLRIGGWWSEEGGELDQRDASAAAALKWVLDREGRDGKVFVFAHNHHLRRGTIAGRTRSFTAMGQHLHLEFGEEMVLIGSLFGNAVGASAVNGPRPGNIESVLRCVGKPSYLLDLRAASQHGPGAEWWTRQQPFDGRVGFGRHPSPTLAMNPAANFDALMFFQEITPAPEIAVP